MWGRTFNHNPHMIHPLACDWFLFWKNVTMAGPPLIWWKTACSGVGRNPKRGSVSVESICEHKCCWIFPFKFWAYVVLIVLLDTSVVMNFSRLDGPSCALSKKWCFHRPWTGWVVSICCSCSEHMYSVWPHEWNHLTVDKNQISWISMVSMAFQSRWVAREEWMH